jgi:hypothetical protein
MAIIIIIIIIIPSNYPTNNSGKDMSTYTYKEKNTGLFVRNKGKKEGKTGKVRSKIQVLGIIFV